MITCFVIGGLSTVKMLEQHIDSFPLTSFVGYSVEPFKDSANPVLYSPQIVFVESSLLQRHKAILVKLAQKCRIIYIAETASDAFQAFEAQAFDYLLKPVPFERFEKSINKFIQFSLPGPMPQDCMMRRTEPIIDSFFIKVDVRGQKLISVKCNEVLFIEADQNYVMLHLVDKQKFLCHNTMKEMEGSLPSANFIRVHKSFIINYDKVSSIEGNVVVLDNNENHRVLIGNTYRKSFFERKNLKMIKKQKASFSAR